MTDKEQQVLQFENLVYRLNNLAQQRKDTVDRLWELEVEGEAMRLELMALIAKGCHK